MAASREMSSVGMDELKQVAAARSMGLVTMAGDGNHYPSACPSPPQRVAPRKQ